jgi:diacylglycerol kinase (ATP)
MIPEISARFAEFGTPEIRASAAKGDESKIAAAAIAEGFTTIVAVGGDGTTHNIGNAILRSGADVRLAVMPAGTGNDFAKLLGTANAGVSTIARMCFEESAQRVDAGRVEDAFFLNCCGFGFDVAVVDGIAANPRLRGNAVYIYTALTQLFTYRGIRIGVKSSLSDRASALHMLLVISNASSFGGAFEIAPGASGTDGKLDAVSILDVPLFRRVALLAAAMRGRHERYRECIRETASEFQVSFDRPPAYELDGELYHAQSTNLTISSCPAALKAVASPGALGR